MIKRPERAVLVEREGVKGVSLTAAGERRVWRKLRAHRLAEAFGVGVPAYGWHAAHDTSGALEDLAEETLLSRVDRAAGYPWRCLHGGPIPTEAGVMPVVRDTPLAGMPARFRGRVGRVQVPDESRLIYLARTARSPSSPLRSSGVDRSKGHYGRAWVRRRRCWTPRPGLPGPSGARAGSALRLPGKGGALLAEGSP